MIQLAQLIPSVLGAPKWANELTKIITRGFESDSRRLQINDVFIAFKGDHFDGHQFIEIAITSGASILIGEHFSKSQVELAQSQKRPIALFEAPNTTEAYRAIASAFRSRLSIPIIAIGGSVGKTTTKEMLKSIWLAKFPETVATQGSENGFLGIPKTLFRASSEQTQALLVEVGIDEPGAMKQHMDLLRPTAGLLTTLGPEHLERLKDIETIVQEEFELIKRIYEWGGSVVINGSDPLQLQEAPHFAGKRTILTTLRLPEEPAIIDTKNSSSMSVLNGIYSPPSNTLSVQCQPHPGRLEPSPFLNLELSLPLPGMHNAHNAMQAIAMAWAYGISGDLIQQGLASFRPSFGRTEILHPHARLEVIADYYNANPSSMAASLQLARERRNNRHLIFVLGDMLELGTKELEYHQELAPLLESIGPNSLYLIGPRMKACAEQLMRNDSSILLIRHYETREELAKALSAELMAQKNTSDCLLLLKGSRGMGLEATWEEALTGLVL